MGCLLLALAALVPLSAAEPPAAPLGMSFLGPEPPQPIVSSGRPYRAGTLAQLSPAEILSWMRVRSEGSASTSKVPRKELPKALPDGFWTLEPRLAALRFVQTNRNAASAADYRLTIDDHDNVLPPEGFTLSLSDAPSGCSAPSGAYEYLVRCAARGSSFTTVRYLRPRPYDNFLKMGYCCDVRIIPLTEKEARQICQVAWWLGRVKSELLEPLGGFGGGAAGSTSDGMASFRLIWPSGHQEFSGVRFARAPGEPVAVSEFSDEYSETARLNLLVRLLRQELPLYLGKRWTTQDVVHHQDVQDLPNLRTEYSTDSRRLLQSVLARIAQNYHGPEQGGEEIIKGALELIGELGLSERIPDLRHLAMLMPPPTSREKETKALSTKIEKLCAQLGPEGTSQSNFLERQMAARAAGSESSALPTSAVTAPAANPTDQPAPALARKYATLDSLYQKRHDLEENEPLGEKATRELRGVTASTLLWLAVCRDPAEVEKRLRQEVRPDSPYCRRLYQLAPQRVLPLLEQAVKREITTAHRLALERAVFEIKETNASPVELRHLTEPLARQQATILRLTNLTRKAPLAAQSAALLHVVESDPSAPAEEILKLLVPTEQPRKFADPAIDAFLITILEQDQSPLAYLRPLVCLALARRGGAAHWARLVDSAAAAARKPNQFGFNSDSILPALALIACAEPDPYRQQLQAILKKAIVEGTQSFEPSFFAAWGADLRELRPALAEIATDSPTAVQGRASGDPDGGPVFRRLHMPRQIVSIWDEPDAPARAKLLIAFVAENQGYFDYPFPAEIATKQIRRAISEVEPQRRGDVRKFILWCLQPERQELRQNQLGLDWVRFALVECDRLPPADAPQLRH